MRRAGGSAGSGRVAGKGSVRRVATRACRRAVAALVLASVTASAVALGAPGERASDAAKPQADASATAGVLPAREPAVRARTAAPPELPPAAVDPSRERDAVLYEAPGDGSLWARGATYKAGFGTEGTLYVPFLGSDAPRVWPVAFRLESVSVGGLALAFDRAAAPVREGDVVRYERGGLLERYELAPGSIEQELVFGALPGSGELVARFAFESDATARETAQGFRFENDRGAVLYGRATALDAGGASVPAATVLTEGGIEIRVPASFVAGARFPLTIDPVVSTFVIDGSTADSLLPDVAYDATTDRWLVVFEEIFSESDHDVYFRLLTSNGTATIANGYVDASLSAYWARPTCANHASADQFLVAAAVGLPSSGARTIQGRTISAGGLLSAAFPISGTDQGGDKLNPDVGGDPYEGTAYYAVVWERVFDPGDRDVHARLITPGGVPTTTNTILIDNSGATVDTVPSISKSNMASIWNVAWQRGPTFGGSIRAARVAWTGSIFTPSFAVPNASSAANPSASSSLAGTHRWAVAYELYPTLAVDVGITLLDGGAVLDQVDLTALEARIDPSFQWLAQFDPTVDSDGEAFAVAYTEPREVGDDLDYDVYAATVSVVGDRLALGEGHRLVLGSNGPEDAPEPAASHDRLGHPGVHVGQPAGRHRGRAVRRRPLRELLPPGVRRRRRVSVRQRSRRVRPRVRQLAEPRRRPALAVRPLLTLRGHAVPVRQRAALERARGLQPGRPGARGRDAVRARPALRRREPQAALPRDDLRRSDRDRARRRRPERVRALGGARRPDRARVDTGLLRLLPRPGRARRLPRGRDVQHDAGGAGDLDAVTRGGGGAAPNRSGADPARVRAAFRVADRPPPHSTASLPIGGRSLARRRLPCCVPCRARRRSPGSPSPCASPHRLPRRS